MLHVVEVDDWAGWRLGREDKGLVVYSLQLMLGTLDSATLSSRHNIDLRRVKGFSDEMTVLLSHKLAHDPVLPASFFNKNLSLFLAEILFGVYGQIKDLVRTR